GLPLADCGKRREWGDKEWNKHNPVSYLAHGRVRKSMAMLDKRGEQLRSLGEPLQAYQNIEHYFNLFCGVVNGVRSPQRGGQLQRSVQRLRAVMPGADHDVLPIAQNPGHHVGVEPPYGEGHGAAAQGVVSARPVNLDAGDTTKAI